MRRSIHVSKGNIHPLETRNFLRYLFSIFVDIFALLNPDLDPTDQNQCGSGSTKLVFTSGNKPSDRRKEYVDRVQADIKILI
jgi:hypothetical protein